MAGHICRLGVSMHDTCLSDLRIAGQALMPYRVATYRRWHAILQVSSTAQHPVGQQGRPVPHVYCSIGAAAAIDSTGYMQRKRHEAGASRRAYFLRACEDLARVTSAHAASVCNSPR
jgi:hypothetical protein